MTHGSSALPIAEGLQLPQPCPFKPSLLLAELFSALSQQMANPVVGRQYPQAKIMPQPRTVLSVASFHGQTLPCGQSPVNVLAGHKGQGELVNGLVELDSMLAPPVCWSWGLIWSNFTQVITRAFQMWMLQPRVFWSNAPMEDSRCFGTSEKSTRQ